MLEIIHGDVGPNIPVKINENSIDLKDEFEKYKNDLKSYNTSMNKSLLNEESNIENPEVRPVYNNVRKE